MQIRITVDCTPIEARTFFGLPDLTPLHNSYLEQIDKLIREGMSPTDFERIVRAWMPGLGDNWENWQRALWSAATGGSGNRS